METKTPLVFLVVLGMFMAMFSVQAHSDGHQLKETKLFAYIHDYTSVGANATDVPVVGFAGKFWRYDQFGTLYVFDDLLTEGPELTSAKLGRIQGTGTTVSLDGKNALVTCSIVFTNEAYNGSTIQIHGGGDQFAPIIEYGVTSGTGKFRYATGYSTWETISYDPSINYAVLRINTTIRH